MANHIFTGSGVALITPMKSDGSVNYDVLEQLLEFHVKNGTDAIIACGTTGEAATLTVEEHCEVLSFVAEKINGRIPVIAGTGSNDTSTAVINESKTDKPEPQNEVQSYVETCNKAKDLYNLVP